MTTRWFVNEDGGVYEYDLITQPIEFPQDLHSAYRTKQEAEAVARLLIGTTVAAEDYFRTVLTIEVLTKYEAWNSSIEVLAEDIANGVASAATLVRVVEGVSRSEMHDLLRAKSATQPSP